MKSLKPFALLAAALFGASNLWGASKPQIEITNVEPPYWWVGMKNDTLQLLLTGKDIAAADVAVDYPGVTLAEQTPTDSPDYKLLYFKISPDAKPGDMQLRLSAPGKKSATLDYTLKARDRKPEEYRGFTSADVMYLLMPDRFARGGNEAAIDYESLSIPERPDRSGHSSRHGGDIAGIIDHLDYLDSLGITTVWATPVLENDMPGGSYHGYATTDYYRIDPRLGTNDDWQRLVSEANKRGIKVVMDMIFNHTGSNHPWLTNPPMSDWYNHPKGDVLTNFRLSTLHDPYVSDFDRDHTVNGWFVTAMPDLNQRNPHLMKYLIQNSIWWIESSKINGIRMDTYPYADMEAMARWPEALLAEYPNFNIVGECWYGNEAGGAFWQRHNKLNPVETNLPTVMDFVLSIDAHKFFDEQTDPWNGLNKLYDHLALDYLYPDNSRILTFLDNHDTDRFLTQMPDSLGSWKQAIAFLLTSRGIPQLYYGTEILMNGTKQVSDGYVRLDFPGGFPGDTVDAFTPEGRTPLQNEAWNFMQKLLQWRRGEANDVIANGSLKHFMPQNGIYTYERRLADKQVVVMLNGNDTPVTTSMERTLEILPYGTTLTDLITGQPVTISEEMTFEPRQILILKNF